jgi:hypothetical protein
MTHRGTRTDGIDELLDALDRIRGELVHLQQALDEIRDEFQQDHHDCTGDQLGSPARRITSFPIDPLATDWSTQVNRYAMSDLPVAPREPTARPPGKLF